MAMQVCSGALLSCSFGLAPSSLVVLGENRVNAGTPAANILDSESMVNVQSFGMCMSPANPSVAAATAAAFGVLTPMPCVPVTPAPWVPGGPTVLIGSAPVLDNNATLMCIWGGVIQIVEPGEFTVEVP
jgi:hypothetical protein